MLILPSSNAHFYRIKWKKMLIFADNILLYANPGTVFYRFGETAPPVPIWVGDKNADKHYNPQPEYVVKFNQQKASGMTATVPVPISNMGAAGRMSYPMTRLARKSDGHAHHASAAAGSDPADQPDSLYVRLQIVEYKPLPTEELPVHIERGDYKVFQFQPVNHVIYRDEQFALTRFGSHRQRPDHDVMKRIQQSAVLKHLGMTDPESEQRGANPPLAQDIRSDAATSHTQTAMTTATSKA
ncbi:hypothetical protein WR25_24689 [Diploscapter pachys]|uniref:Uncharacterized protein n=1 Tax=Diploscapter pachys TaxID=2018661 RepID=A0A2A2L569_9BILA|nr:hypothetical protein WR25_24689 [Diploscapter pachys]